MGMNTKSKKKCVSCSRCLSFCPVFLAANKEELSPKAKNQLFELLQGNESQLDEKMMAKLAGMCVSCGRCVNACAQKLSVPERLGELRREHPRWEQYLWDVWISRGDTLWPALGTIGRALGNSSGKGMIASVRALGSGSEVTPWVKVKEYDCRAQGRPVFYFAGCTARRVRPQWVKKSRKILERLGFHIVTMEDACCGSTLLSAGLEKSALQGMRANVERWRSAGRPLVATACTSCLYGLANYVKYPELFQGDTECGQWAESLTNIASLWGGTAFRVDQPPSVVRWHAPCHGLSFKDDHAWLVRTTDGLVTSPSMVSCCGLGGVTQLVNKSLCMQVNERCWGSLAPEQGTQVVTGCSGCTIQLTATRPDGVEVAHWLDIVET